MGNILKLFLKNNCKSCIKIKLKVNVAFLQKKKKIVYKTKNYA